MADRFKIVCGACKSDPRLVRDADGDVVVCLGCGQRDSVDAASRTAAEHQAHSAAGPETGRDFKWQVVRA